MEGYDFCLHTPDGEGVRLFSATTWARDDETEEFMVLGLGTDSPSHQHILFQRQGDELAWGEAIMTPGRPGPTYRQNFSTGTPPVVAWVSVDYDEEAERYSVGFEEALPGSTVASTPWNQRDYLKRDVCDLPGEYGQSGRYELTLLLGILKSTLAFLLVKVPEN